MYMNVLHVTLTLLEDIGQPESLTDYEEERQFLENIFRHIRDVTPVLIALKFPLCQQ